MEHVPGSSLRDMLEREGKLSAARAVRIALELAGALTRVALAERKEKEPALAATFHGVAAHLLSERLSATTRTLEAVLR